MVQKAQNNLEGAIESNTEALKNGPKSVKAYWNRCQCYRQLKKYKEAIADLQYLCRLEPRNS